MPTDIDLARLWRVVRIRYRVVLVFAALFTLAGIVYLHVASRAYAVSIQVVPVAPPRSAGGGALSSLGELAGVDIGSLAGGGSTPFQLYLSGVQSRTVADILANDPRILRAVFPEEWSDEAQGWQQPFSLTRPVKTAIFGVLGIPVQPWTPPSGERLYDYLQENLVVLEETKSPVVTLRIESSHPQQILFLLSRLNAVTDTMLKGRALRRADQYIAYIGHELDNITVSEYRTALLQNLYDQEKTRMMAGATVSFASDVFSGPTIGSRPSSPKAPLVLAFALLGGAVVGAFVAIRLARSGLSLSFWRKQRREAGDIGE